MLPRIQFLPRKTAVVSAALGLASLLPAQQPSPLKQHYDAAYRLQSEGNLTEADAEHTTFLVMALHQLAIGYSNAGDYDRAAPLYDEGLALASNNLLLRKDYAEAAIDAQQPLKAQELLKGAFANSASFPSAVQGEAHRVLADSYLIRNQDDEALANYKAAYELDHSYESLYALGVGVLTVKGYAEGAKVFAQLIARFGDKSATRMAIGHAYGVAVLPAQAAEEFKKALLKDPRTPGAHYGIGAALLNAGNEHNAAAQAEFRKELAINPSDALSWLQLGRIAGEQKNAKEAETDLKNAANFAPDNPDVWMELGKLYMDQQRTQEAEPAFRKAITATVDPARNNYAIERAHFSLGRILQGEGKAEEARRELAIAAELLDKHRGQEEDSMKGQRAVNASLHRSRGATDAEKASLREFAQGIAPLIAGSYNNLGVHAAMASDFKKAEANFAHAAEWQPDLHGVDSNWGRAAFAAQDYAAAIAPLERAFAAHPEDAELRGMLAESKQRIAKTN